MSFKKELFLRLCELEETVLVLETRIEELEEKLKKGKKWKME